MPNASTIHRDRLIEAAADRGLRRLTKIPSVAVLHDHVHLGGTAPSFQRDTEGELLAAALLALGIECPVTDGPVSEPL